MEATTALAELTEFYDRLARLKWHRLILGDDWRTFEEHTRLLGKAVARGGDFRALYDAFSAYHASGPAFGTERAPMPQRPSGQLTIV